MPARAFVARGMTASVVAAPTKAFVIRAGVTPQATDCHVVLTPPLMPRGLRQRVFTLRFTRLRLVTPPRSRYQFGTKRYATLHIRCDCTTDAATANFYHSFRCFFENQFAGDAESGARETPSCFTSIAEKTR